MTDETVGTRERTENGFELEGRFYRWHVTDTGKDLMLIDRFTGMPVPEFFELIEDSFDRGRAPITLALIATSIRADNPDWSVERIVRLVQAKSLSRDYTWIESDAEEQLVPPAEAGQESAPSESPADESSPSSTPEETSNFATLYEIPA